MLFFVFKLIPIYIVNYFASAGLAVRADPSPSGPDAMPEKRKFARGFEFQKTRERKERRRGSERMDEHVTLRSRRGGSPVAAHVVRASDNKTLFSPVASANEGGDGMEEFNTPPPNSFVKPPPVHVVQDSI